jgi:hypothetical protein
MSRSTCTVCNTTLSSLASLKIHQTRNKSCIQKQRQQQKEFEETKEKEGDHSSHQHDHQDHKYNVTEEEEAEIRNPAQLWDKETQIMDTTTKSLLLSILYYIASSFGGSETVERRGTEPHKSMLQLLREGIQGYDSTVYDPTMLKQFKEELFTYLAAQEYHINAVWEGILQGVFNPARGRGGNPAVPAQQQICAVVILKGLTELKMKNPILREVLKKKMQHFNEYDYIRPAQDVGAGPELPFESYTPASQEKPLRNLKDYLMAMKWFHWQFMKTKMVVKMGLKHPVSLRLVLGQWENKYKTIVDWLKRSPLTSSTTTTIVQSGFQGGVPQVPTGTYYNTYGVPGNSSFTGVTPRF